jgi:MFS family permease
MSVVIVGGALGQWPIGRFSDFVDRRKVLIVAMLGAALAGFLLWQLASVGVAAILIMGFFFGAFTLPAYSLAVAHAFDWTKPGDMVETSASIIALYGIGSIVGPLLAPFFMQAFGGDALFLYTALVSVGLVGFVAYRIRRRPAPSAAEKSDFDIYSTAPVGGAITPEPIDAEMPMVEVPSPVPYGADAQEPGDLARADAPDEAGGDASSADRSDEGGLAAAEASAAPTSTDSGIEPGDKR